MSLGLGGLDSSVANMSTAMDTVMDDAMEVGAINVDLGDVDLFGEDIGLDMPSRPPSKQLYQRLDELRSRGGCR
jgi:hypothetical protein